VSDATPLAGLPDSEYSFPGIPKISAKDRKAYLSDGMFARSTLTLDEALSNLTKWGIGIDKALIMLSKNPASLLGLRKGEMKPGYDADLVVLDKDLKVFATIVNGDIIYKK